MRKVAITMLTMICMSLFMHNLVAEEGFQDNEMIIEAKDLLPEELNDLSEGWDTQTLLKFSAGETFPLDLFYESEFFSLNSFDEPVYSVTVTKDFYVRIPEKGKFLFSLDGITWKELFEIVTGDFQLGLRIDDTFAEPYVFIGGHLYERSQNDSVANNM